MPDAAERRFLGWLVALTVAGLALRVLFALTVYGNELPAGDGAYYHEQANAVSEGEGFIDPLVWPEATYDAAHHPPMYTIYLAAGSVVGLDTPAAHRVLSCLAGAVGILLVGLLGRRLAGPRAGLIAAGLTAVYPNLWLNDTLVLSESLYAPLVAGTLLLAYGFLDAPTWRRAAALGALLGIVVLTRAEAANLVLFLVLPLVIVAVGRDWKRGLALLASTGVAMVVVVSPWVVYNLARFERPVYISLGAAGVVPSANCDETYSGSLLGYWSARCTFADPAAVSELFKPNPSGDRLAAQADALLDGHDESVLAEENLERGLDYVRAHKGRAPVVALARVGRMWDVYRPAQAVQLNAAIEDRHEGATVLGLVMYYELLVLGAAGLVVLWRRGVSIIPFVSMAILVTFTALVAIGLNRYRVPVEVGLVVLAGVAVDAALDRLWPPVRRR